MNDIKKPIYREYVRELVQQLRRVIFHGEYAFKVVYFKKPLEGTKNADGERFDVVASICIDPIYLNFTLNMYPTCEKWWKQKEYKKLAETLVHEISHLITEPQFNFAWNLTRAGLEEQDAKDIRERQTQRVANIICHLLPDGYWLPKNVFKKPRV